MGFLSLNRSIISECTVTLFGRGGHVSRVVTCRVYHVLVWIMGARSSIRFAVLR